MDFVKLDYRSVDAWPEGEDGWTWNESFHLDWLYVERKNETKLVNEFFKENFNTRDTEIVFDGDIYEIQIKRLHRPIYALIPQD